MIVGIIIGFFIGIISSAIYRSSKKKEDTPKYLRRGLLVRTYVQKNSKNEVEATYEIGEIEATDDMSKIAVISLKTDQSRYHDSSSVKTLTDMIDNSWVNSSEIKWITTVGMKRNEKIDQILGK